MNIVKVLEQGQYLCDGGPALICETESFSYRELDELSSRLANGVAGLGVERGDRVVLLLPNSLAFLIAYFGLQKLGAVAVALSPALQAEEVAFSVRDSSAVAVLTTAALCSKVPDLVDVRTVIVAEGCADGTIALDALLAAAAPEAIAADLGLDEPAALLYTSGTTGSPKGAVFTHGNVLSNVAACIEAFALQSEDRVLLCLPTSHCFGQNAALNPTLAAGATLILERDFAPERAAQVIAKH